mgnify:CR=1 FL=1
MARAEKGADLPHHYEHPMVSVAVDCVVFGWDIDDGLHVLLPVELQALVGLAVQVDGELRDDAVRRAVATLPPRYRDVIILYYFHEMDLAETARTSGLREGTVKARLFRGRKLLQDKLAGLMSRTSLATDEA